MPDVDNKKRRDLIMRMAMDVPKKAQGDAHLTEGPVMRQGEPKDDEGLEDSLQADDLLMLGAPVLGAGAGLMAKMMAKGLSPKVASMIRLIGKSGADLQSLKRADMNQRHSDSSLWMNDDYAAALGVPKNPAWQKKLTPDDIKTPSVPTRGGASSWPEKNDDGLASYFEKAGGGPAPLEKTVPISSTPKDVAPMIGLREEDLAQMPVSSGYWDKYKSAMNGKMSKDEAMRLVDELEAKALAAEDRGIADVWDIMREQLERQVRRNYGKFY